MVLLSSILPPRACYDHTVVLLFTSDFLLVGLYQGTVEKSENLFGPAGICGDRSGPAGIFLASHSETFCNLVVASRFCPRPTVISPGQNSLQDWTDYES